jgi:8-oxo-dGTP pyrophosphatase MutT (NUDIX family)
MFTHNIYRNIRVRVIVIHNGALLMNAPVADSQQAVPYRCLPGGGLEANESLFEAGEREVCEETGLNVSVTSVAFLREWIVPKKVSLDEMKEAIKAWGFSHPDTPCPEYAYGLEVFLWAKLADNASTELQPMDGHGAIGDWIPLAQIENEALFPRELRALAQDILAGRSIAGVPSFVTGLGNPFDQPDKRAFY